MKQIRYLLLIIIFAVANLAVAGNTTPYALIYNGLPTCEGCPEAIADAAVKAGLPVKFVSHSKEIPALLNHAAIFIIGGTEDNLAPARKVFHQKNVRAIKEYVKNGGHYLGICGGGFLAAEFGIIPATAIDYSETSNAHLETISWHGKDVVLYFQAGPAFILDKNAQHINIIATYQDGKIAAFESTYGKGKVVVVGPHPEADKTWLEEDNIDSTHWESKQELAVALIKQIVGQTK